jgi:hypothetical protein
MISWTQEELVRVARTYYPVSQRWEAAWDRALNWKECDALIQAVQAAFPSHRVGRFVQPRRVACLYCILVQEKGAPGGERVLTRIVGAISVLAPVYLVYVTTETLGTEGTERRSAHPRISFTPEEAERPDMSTLAQLIEHHLGYRPFPRELAEVPLPDLRVDFLHSEPPTLLRALFANRLENLP